jgi:valyl-tRNA synthetase
MFFIRLAGASEIEIAENVKIEKAVTAISESARVFIPLKDLIDTEKEMLRLNKEKEKAQKDIDFLNGKLSNKGFVDKAPEKLIEAEREKLKKAEERLSKIEQSINELN